MFSIAFLIGLYANSIFLLGLANFLSPISIIGFTLLYIFLAVIFWEKFDEKIEIQVIKHELIYNFQKHPVWSLSIGIAFVVALLGALAPETAYDALWYHLTLPKLFLSFGGIRYIPGGLFYYSAMPKVGELLYTAALSFGNDILAHIIHFVFALLTGIAIYCITKKLTTKYIALIAVAIFMSNIVVLWEATTAYIDLIRTFFEVMALWGMLTYLEKKDRKWLIESAFLFGLALETKLVAIASLPIFLGVILIFSVKKVKERLKDAIIFILLALLVCLPWFVFSYIHTGNPIYPLFSAYPISLGDDTLAFPNLITDLVTVFITSSDPVSPIYLILAPLVIILWKQLKRQERMLVFLSVLGLLLWDITPKTGGGRFLLPYLPLFSITAAVLLFKLPKVSKLYKISLMSIFIVLLIATSYRATAELKSLPYIFGQESKNTYLAKHLNFSYGDYYDHKGSLKKIMGERTVLLYGFHNLYYMDVPFIDSSYVKKGDTFSFIATQNTTLPKRFAYWKPIFFDPVTRVTLFSIGQDWVY